MKEGGLFGGTTSVLERSLDLRSSIHNTVSSNIANMNSINYEPVRVDFAEEMERALFAGKAGELSATHESHMSRPVVLGARHPGWVEDPLYEFRDSKYMDQVDMDEEMYHLSKNNLMYTASAQLIARKFRGLLSAIQSGGK
jgi:flagellar basal-body rod protein FlgB